METFELEDLSKERALLLYIKIVCLKSDDEMGNIYWLIDRVMRARLYIVLFCSQYRRFKEEIILASKVYIKNALSPLKFFQYLEKIGNILSCAFRGFLLIFNEILYVAA